MGLSAPAVLRKFECCFTVPPVRGASPDRSPKAGSHSLLEPKGLEPPVLFGQFRFGIRRFAVTRCSVDWQDERSCCDPSSIKGWLAL